VVKFLEGDGKSPRLSINFKIQVFGNPSVLRWPSPDRGCPIFAQFCDLDRERTFQARCQSKDRNAGRSFADGIQMKLSGHAEPWGRAQVEWMLPQRLHARMINRCPRQGHVLFPEARCSEWWTGLSGALSRWMPAQVYIPGRPLVPWPVLESHLQ
jgi:hypothetical protein